MGGLFEADGELGPIGFMHGEVCSLMNDGEVVEKMDGATDCGAFGSSDGCEFVQEGFGGSEVELHGV